MAFPEASEDRNFVAKISSLASKNTGAHINKTLFVSHEGNIQFAHILSNRDAHESMKSRLNLSHVEYAQCARGLPRRPRLDADGDRFQIPCT